MPGDEVRARYLRDRVMTATPAQRVVMLYDRLGLDLTRADDEQDVHAAGRHVSHAMEIVAELRASLDVTAGGPAENLAAIYSFLLRELIAVRTGELTRLSPLHRVVSDLRSAWAQASEIVANSAASSPAVAGSWVG